MFIKANSDMAKSDIVEDVPQEQTSFVDDDGKNAVNRTVQYRLKRGSVYYHVQQSIDNYGYSKDRVKGCRFHEDGRARGRSTGRFQTAL
jgi:hypothetical protein